MKDQIKQIRLNCSVDEGDRLTALALDSGSVLIGTKVVAGAGVVLRDEQRSELASFLADPEPAVTGDLRLLCAHDEGGGHDLVDFHLDGDGELRVEVQESDGEAGSVRAWIYLDDAAQAKLRRYLNGLPEQTKELLDCAVDEAAEDLERVREARVEDQSWPAHKLGTVQTLADADTLRGNRGTVQMDEGGTLPPPTAWPTARCVVDSASEARLRDELRNSINQTTPRDRTVASTLDAIRRGVDQRRVSQATTKELIDEALRRVNAARDDAKARIGDGNRDAGREYSLSITALEDAQMRFTRGLSKQIGTFKPVDLERVDAATERNRFVQDCENAKSFGSGIYR